jgi:deoxycytidine triphosphate deaminase
VLSKDEIKFYCSHYALISPFDEGHLKPAAYELSVGALYAKAGQVHTLPPDGSFEIEPFEVAIIQTLETINMPDFLIGRWNIKVGRAYDGLLWVGGPQVDAGYRGYLCCPLYNLSDKPVRLSYGNEIAVIDFVTTTPPTCDPQQGYDYANRTRLVFADYRPQSLKSAIVTQLQGRIAEFGKELGKFDEKTTDFQRKADSFASATFTVIAMLFAAVGLAVSRTGEVSSSIATSTAWMSAIAFWFAIQAYWATQQARNGARLSWSKLPGPSRLQIIGFAVVFVALLLAHLTTVRSTVRELLDSRSSMASKHDLQRVEADLGRKVDVNNAEIRSRVEALQKEVDRLLAREQPRR